MRPTRVDIDQAKAIVRQMPHLDSDDEVDLDRLPPKEAEHVERQVEQYYADAVPHFRKLLKGEYSQITRMNFVVQHDCKERPHTVVYYYAIEGDLARVGPHPEAPETPILVYPDGRAVACIAQVPLSRDHLFQELCEARIFERSGRA